MKIDVYVFRKSGRGDAVSNCSRRTHKKMRWGKNSVRHSVKCFFLCDLKLTMAESVDRLGFCFLMNGINF